MRSLGLVVMCCALSAWGCGSSGSGGHGSAGGAGGTDAGLDAMGGSAGSTPDASGGQAGSGGSGATGGSAGAGGAGATGGAAGSGGTAGSGGASGAGGASGGSAGSAGSGGTAGSGGSDAGTGGSSGSGGTSGSGGASGNGGTGGTSGSTGSGGTGGGGNTGACVSGATGNYAVRFQWLGNGAGSTAYVSYTFNNLPDTSNWKVGAYSSNIGYTPVYDDIYLGAGGLDLEGTAFIDVNMSTAGLSSINHVTLSIYGRSFSTYASGSFNWQTFDGTGTSPYGGIANSTPYEWYSADATAAFTPGNSGVLLRIKPDGPSSALIVDYVEICFDAN